MLLSVGFENRVNWNKIVAIVPSETSPAARQIQMAKKEGRLIDCTRGRKTRTVIFFESGQLATSAVSVNSLVARWKGGKKTVDTDSIVIEGEGTA